MLLVWSGPVAGPCWHWSLLRLVSVGTSPGTGLRWDRFQLGVVSAVTGPGTKSLFGQVLGQFFCMHQSCYWYLLALVLGLVSACTGPGTGICFHWSWDWSLLHIPGTGLHQFRHFTFPICAAKISVK